MHPCCWNAAWATAIDMIEDELYCPKYITRRRRVSRAGFYGITRASGAFSLHVKELRRGREAQRVGSLGWPRSVSAGRRRPIAVRVTNTTLSLRRRPFATVVYLGPASHRVKRHRRGGGSADADRSCVGRMRL
ncbi:hypothetical protein PSPO01_10082 [Paraphaeosphaeria sporulosa]